MNPSLLGLAALLLFTAAAPARADGSNDLSELGQGRVQKFKKTAPAASADAPEPKSLAQTDTAADEGCANFHSIKRPDSDRQFLPLDAGETLDVDAPRGQFKLIVQPSGAAAIDAIDAERRKEFKQDFDAAQARMLRCTRAASQVILITSRGELLGVHKTTKRYYQPYEIWSYELNETGRTKKVVLTKGTAGEASGLCVRFFDQDGVEFHRAFVEPLDVIDEKNDKGDKAFQSICGEPMSS